MQRYQGYSTRVMVSMKRTQPWGRSALTLIVVQLLLSVLGTRAATDVGVPTSIPLSASLNDTENICLQPDLVQTEMCVMNLGPDPTKTYSSIVMLRGRGFTNASTAHGFTIGADASLRPDLVVTAVFRTVSAFSDVRATAVVSVDMFLCSEPTCNNVVDLNYVTNQKVAAGEGLQAGQVGFRIGVVPQTRLAVGIPLPGSTEYIDEQVAVPSDTAPASVQSVVRSQRSIGGMPVANFTPDAPGYAVLGTRVALEAFSDYLAEVPSLGFGAFMLGGTCTYLLYPNNPWYQQYIVATLSPCNGMSASQTFVLRGLKSAGGGRCYFCDSASVSIADLASPCYPTDFLTCGEYTLPSNCNNSASGAGPVYHPINMTINQSINQTASGWELLLYNLTSELQCDYSQNQSTWQHLWSTIMFEVIAEGRNGVPVGCNYTLYPCPSAGMSGQQQADREAQEAGFSAFAAALQQKWVVGSPGEVFSMLGYERASLDHLNASVLAVETWALQLADSAAISAASNFNFVLTVPGWFALFATNLAATIGAWAGYSGVEDWIIAMTSHASAASRRRRAVGKILAILLVMLITLVPLLISVLTDLLANQGNYGKSITTFSQEAFQAPGYGNYVVAALGQVAITAADSKLPLAMGIPFLFTLLCIGFAAVLLTEHRRRQQDRIMAQQPHVKSASMELVSGDLGILRQNSSHLGIC